MNHKSRTSQGGFSLVELMVVVAIIGVLASIAVPAVNKYIAKARQSEAKTSLSSLYTSEKAFYAEYTAYHTAFQAVGYSPEGKMRYNVGYGGTGASNADTANGFNAASVTNTNYSTKTYCVAGGGTMTASQSCSILNGASGAVPADLAAAYTVSTAAGTFLAGAAAVIHAGATGGDVWSIDHNKDLKNVTNGIP